jgi:L-ascorbate metabolism protein UlaG (beta-lactamase superfamily)
VSHDGVSIQAVPAYNTEHGSSTHKQYRKGQSVGYLIAMEGRRLYHAGDTDFIPEMRELGEVDIAFLPIGGKLTMDISEAVEATIAISPGAVVPIHRFGADQRVFAQEVERKLGIPCLPLEIGQAHQLEA